MNKLIALLTILILAGGCTMTDVSTDQEEIKKTETKTRKNSAHTGIVIIPTTTTNS